MKLRLIAMLLGLVVLSGCGNKDLVDTVYSYNRAMIATPEGPITVFVQKWGDYENSDMLQVIDVDGKAYLTHSTNIVLIQD